jgi:hypothetical protein
MTRRILLDIYFYSGFLLDLFFNTEDGGDTFLRNVFLTSNGLLITFGKQGTIVLSINNNSPVISHIFNNIFNLFLM